jgi:mRNA interferase HigB
MRVISKARLKAFWSTPGHQGAEGPLRAWFTHVNNKTVAWHGWGDVKSSFATASLVGNCTVFNIGGNKFHLIARSLYASQKVFVLKIMTHREYDENKWPDECGCSRKAPPGMKKQVPKGK